MSSSLIRGKYIIGRGFKIGKQAINNRVEFYYNAEKPESAPDWSWSFTFEFLFPK